MNKRSVFIGLFVRLPLVLITIFLALVVYLVSQPRFCREWGERLYNQGDYESAIYWFQEGAAKGDAVSQNERDARSTLDFEFLHAGGEHFVTLFGDKDGVFDANAPPFRVIKSRLDGDDVARAQFLVVGR